MSGLVHKSEQNHIKHNAEEIKSCTRVHHLNKYKYYSIQLNPTSTGHSPVDSTSTYTLYANWDTLSSSWAPPAGSKPRPAEKPGKPKTTHRQQTQAPRGTSGSNPSTESSTNSIRKATDNMQMPCKGSRLQSKAGRQRISTTAQQQNLIKGKTVSGHELQANVRKQYPNEASQQEESNATTLTSIRVVYRRQSKKIRELRLRSLFNLTADKNWEQLYRQLKLSQLIFLLANRSYNRSHSMPKQRSLKPNDVAENYCRNWTLHPLLTAGQLTNICSQRNNRSLTLLKTNAATAESSSLIQNAVVPTNPNDDVEVPATKTC
ncbi:autophagy 4a [Dorcoceras hygrometricum]|uniref:Autophagy 4a n=1 Tax=Dorcoceras hygrometricum TaxID=472368 RepID=A0A2Z7CHQ2_9LAMI|nr:autophagy 4a [Dorcoceras hygrometricum]